MARKTKKMRAVEERHNTTLEELLPRLITDMGMSAAADHIGVSKATMGYWLLKLDLVTRRVVTRKGERIFVERGNKLEEVKGGATQCKSHCDIQFIKQVLADDEGGKSPRQAYPKHYTQGVTRRDRHMAANEKRLKVAEMSTRHIPTIAWTRWTRTSLHPSVICATLALRVLAERIARPAHLVWIEASTD